MDSLFWRVPQLKDLECIRVRGSRHSFPRHFHETYVIEVVEKGTNEFWCEGQTYSALSGEIIVIHPGEIHTGYPSGDEELCYRAFYPHKDLMMDLTEQIRGDRDLPWFESRVIKDAQLARMFQKAHIRFELVEKRSAACGLMVLALRNLMERYERGGVESAAVREFVCSQKRIQRVLDLLAMRYHENVSLNELSSLCGLSEYHFLRTFKKFTGLAPYEYIVATRVEECKKLLSRGISIADTAARTGFYDQSHLSRHFKKITGITPGKYAARAEEIRLTRDSAPLSLHTFSSRFSRLQ